jgi:hypothetical protein
MNLQQAAAFVAEHSDDDDLDDDDLNEDDINEAFTVIFGRSPDDEDRENGMWSMMVAACNSPFILVCHPHSKPGFATSIQSEQDLVWRWLNGNFDYRCNCNCLKQKPPIATYEAAIKDIGQHMHHVKRLNSRAEYEEYMAGSCHKKTLDEVYYCACLLGWDEFESDEPAWGDN